MCSCSEYRAAAWQTTREGHWVSKYLLVVMVMSMAFGIVQALWSGAVTSMGIQTWTMFLMAKAQALQSGLVLTVPSRTIALRMTEASAFEMFICSITYGISAFAVASLFLRAAKGARGGWFASSFAGFKYPLGVAWLYFRYFVQILIWSLLFVVPGIMAYYRYCQSWNLKVEHPDWSAGKCLAESTRMMDGHKAQRFALDLSYWKPIAALMFGLFVMTVLATGLAIPDPSPVLSSIASAAFLAFAFICIWGGIALAVYMSIGRAMFYLDLTKTKNEE